MNKLVVLETAKQTYKQGAIELLEETITMVKSGELEDVMVIGIGADRTVYNRCSGTLERSRRICALWDLLRDASGD